MNAMNESSWSRLARWLVRWLVRRFYPRVEITGRERIPQTGPVLFCANHANSLLDPVLIGIAARRPVQFMAKAPLFQVPVLGPLMYALGMVPAYRGSDDPRQVRRNLESLDVAAEVLQRGGALGIFPEGRSHDAAQVETVRSGAARIAVQAVEKGAYGLQVVPVGINYEHKDRFRSSVWVQVGEPIDVDAHLAAHGGDARGAMRALTPELESRLKAVVVHLDEPQWEPFLNDLEVLVPPRKEFTAGKAGAVRLRKRIADALNHFLQVDRPRTEALAEQIAAYRQAVYAEGLRVHSPVLQYDGWRLWLVVLWQRVWTLVLFPLAVVGTLFHIVPFTIVRSVSAKIRPPGRTAVSLWLLLVGLPVYGLWYTAAGWWLWGYFTHWFASACLALLPWLGLMSLWFWRETRNVLSLWWHVTRFLFGRGRLQKLRVQRNEIRRQLAELAAEYATVAPPPPPAPKRSWVQTGLRIAKPLAAAGVLALGAWFGGHWLAGRTLIDPDGGVDLAAIPRPALEARLAGDEQSLRAVLSGLNELEARAVALQADFAAGRRTYQNEADNDAIRQLLLTYVNYRTVLVRLIWRYQRYAQLEDEALRLRAFLVGYASASALYDAGLKFVYQFNRSPETIARLNEGEPVWNIPPGLYDTVQRNLASRHNTRLLAAARQYYDAAADRWEAHGLSAASEYKPFHDAIAQGEATARRLLGSQWTQEAIVAIKDLRKLVGAIRYETQSAISTWIGDMKIREPRRGKSLIGPQELAQFAAKLQPGDVLLERRNWFLSNAFLPGYWPHAALYVGTTDDLKRLGLDQDPRVQRFWREFSRPDAEGHRHVIVEALSEGIVFSSLEHSIGQADSAAILRPNLTPEEIREAIASAFSHAAKPYDFEFDFTSRDKLVCTEVVFRAYGANSGPIRFPLKQILGRETMPAIELVRKVKEESASDTAELRFVAFIDGDEAVGTATYREDAAGFFQTLDRPALTMLQGLEERRIRQIGPLGWTLLSLMAVFTVGNLAYYGTRPRD